MYINLIGNKNKSKKEMKYLMWAVVIGIVITYVATYITSVYARETQQRIASPLIRLHILANSDSDYDQYVKLRVRNAVINEFEYIFDGNSKEEAEKLIAENMDSIKEFVNNYLDENGYEYGASVQYTNVYFPTKVYGDITLPNGNYDALQIKIGAAEGQNWWCVLFPPLCYVEQGFVEIDEEAKKQLKTEVGNDYSLISGDDIKVKFKVVEYFNKK